MTLAQAVISGVDAHSPYRLLPFHRSWLKAVFSDGIEIGALSCPRGSAKTFLASALCALAMRPGSCLWRPPLEVLAVSGSLEQSRILLGMVRESLQDVEAEYSWAMNGQRLTCTHKVTKTRLRILSSSGRLAMGLANYSIICADEPGSWRDRDGALLFDALRQSLGKLPHQRLIIIGTRAPAQPGSWWPSLVDAGSKPGRHVTELSAPAEAPWWKWSTISDANPLLRASASLRKTVLRERDEARTSETERASFRAYRLNQRDVSTATDSLTTLEDWRRVEARVVPPRRGRPVVGIDLGQSRSWSAAWCLFPGGRSEVFAVVPGIPSLADREKADSVPAGLYQRLADDGVLVVDEGVRVSSPRVLIDHLRAQGIRPQGIVADRFLAGALEDAVRGRFPILFRKLRQSESTEDISAWKRLVADGPLSIVPEAKNLVAVSLAATVTKTDTSGNTWCVKKSTQFRHRDDVAVAGLLAAGQMMRMSKNGQRRPLRTALAG